MPLERDEQRWLVEAMQAMGLDFTHVPNGGQRSKVTGACLKREGVQAGIPDLLIFTTPPRAPLARGVAIELKRRAGGRVSESQSGWLARLEACGWLVRVCEGLDQALGFLAELGWAVGGTRR